MKFNIYNQKFDIEEVNLIAINQTRWMGATLNFFITIFNKENSFDYGKTKDIVQIVKEFNKINSFIKSNGLNNFALVGNQYLINMDNVKNINHMQNRVGDNVVCLTFKNGKSYNLYSGYNKTKADILIKSYNKQADKYFNVVTFK